MAQSPKSPPATSATVSPPPANSRPRGHGRVERGLDAVARQPEGFGRFGRMFPELAPARFGDTREKEQALMFDISKTMIKKDDGALITDDEAEDENPAITAGYTYFGQFIDHDITFDTASDLDRDNDPGGVEDFRTARLDLDSVYGKGPTDQPYLYNADRTIKLGSDKTPTYLGQAPHNKRRFDVQRAPHDESGEFTPKDVRADCERAVIGDPRNDENNIVVQIHALWQRFHNKIMAELALDKFDANGDPIRKGLTMDAAFNTAQRQVRWHYQWVVLNDFLKRIVGEATFDAVYNGGQPKLEFYKPHDARYPFMPVEFSVAAYRFGHSMVRPSYSLSAMIPHMVERDPTKKLNRLKIFSKDFLCKDTTSLNGFRPLIPSWGIDWSFFLSGLNIENPLPPDENAKDGLKFSDFRRPQPAYRIDTLLVDPLQDLPDHQEMIEQKRSLPSLNLLRGLALGLPSGQAVARRMNAKVLTDDELWNDDGNLKEPSARKALFKSNKQQLYKNAPLWYYVLREAELVKDDKDSDVGGKPVRLGGRHLGDVGGRIVAEVLIGLVMADDQSFLVQDPQWKPTARPEADIGKPFELADIVRYVDR